MSKSDMTAPWFPNRTWPWRTEDDGDREAEVERKDRQAPPSRIINERVEYGTPQNV